MAVLPSWNDGAAKSAILDFVARVTTEDGPDYVRPAERSPLAQALDKSEKYGITLVSMKNDWSTVFDHT